MVWCVWVRETASVETSRALQLISKPRYKRKARAQVSHGCDYGRTQRGRARFEHAMSVLDQAAQFARNKALGMEAE